MNRKNKYWKGKENSQEEQACDLISSVIYSPCRPVLWLPNVQGVPNCIQSVLQQTSAGCNYGQLWLGNIYLEKVLDPKVDNLVPKTSCFMRYKPQVGFFLGFWMGNFELLRYTLFLDFTNNILECPMEPRETHCFSGV